MKAITAYICDFCPRKKRYASASTAKSHEDMCFFNPVRQACATCKHFNFVPLYTEHDTGYSEGGPECSEGLLNNDPESSTELRADCEGWERKDGAIVPLTQIRIA